MASSSSVGSWAAFDRELRYRDDELLSRLSAFNDVLLVAGCQRSGTTAVTRLLREALGTQYPRPTRDDELDAALILAGRVPFEPDGRCCFQTTYVNDRFHEYFQHDNYRLVWIVRKPDAVVRSMLSNWSRGALNRLFRACGQTLLDDQGKTRYRRWGSLALPRLEKACLSYAAKTAQVRQIAARIGPQRLFVADYDELLDHTNALLPRLFAFAGVNFDDVYLGRLGRSRRSTRDSGFNRAQQELIERICQEEYEWARRLRHDYGGAPPGVAP